MSKILLFFIILLATFSCSKDENDSAGFSYLDIEDAYGLVLGKLYSGNDSLKLFKINQTDNLQIVDFLNGNKDKVHTNRIPIAFYDLNNAYFVVTFKYGGVETMESYLVRRFDGRSQKLPKAVLAEFSGITDLRIDALRSDKQSNYYYTNSKGNWKLNLTNIELPVISEILKNEVLGANFTVDYLGNIITDKKVFSISGSSKNLDSGNSTSFPVQSFLNSAYYLYQKGDSIKFSQVDVSSADITEQNMNPGFFIPGEASDFIGSYEFSDLNKIIVLFSSAIFQIQGSEIKRIDLSSVNLNKIISGRCSDNYCFIYGENAVNDKVLARINFMTDKPLYTQILAPGEVDIKNFSVTIDDKVAFSGIRISDNKKLFGYVPFSGSNWIIDDDLGVAEIQIMVR